MKKTFFTALCGLFALLAFAERKTPTTVIMQVTDPQMGFYTDNRDMVYETEALTRIVEAINRIRPDAVVFTGDYVHDTDNEGQWIGFLRIIAEVSAVSAWSVPWGRISPFPKRLPHHACVVLIVIVRSASQATCPS